MSGNGWPEATHHMEASVWDAAGESRVSGHRTGNEPEYPDRLGPRAARRESHRPAGAFSPIRVGRETPAGFRLLMGGRLIGEYSVSSGSAPHAAAWA